MVRLDKLLSQHLGSGQKPARETLRQGNVRVNGQTERACDRLIDKFDHVQVGEREVQALSPRYLALHKPSGHVSATMDPEHPTVIDLVQEPWADTLHLAGRLDRFTTGLVILSNDGSFTDTLTRPQSKIAKVYRVGTDKPISTEAIDAFQTGIYLAKEAVTTQPAKVEPTVDSHACLLTIYEGKHHQVKRMFAQFEIKVVALHRLSVGQIHLGDLPVGQWRFLTSEETHS